MATPEYVFTALVHDKNQPLELMAYAIYKADKNEIAENMKADSKSQEEIDRAIQAFHDSVLNSTSLLQAYRVRAQALGRSLIYELNSGAKAEFRQDFIDRIEQLVKTEKSWYHHIGTFIFDAIKNVLSTIFIIVLFGGIYSLFLSKDSREALYGATGQSLMDVATGEIPVVDKFRAELAKKKKEQQEKAARESNKPPSTQP